MISQSRHLWASLLWLMHDSEPIISRLIPTSLFVTLKSTRSMCPSLKAFIFLNRIPSNKTHPLYIYHGHQRRKDQDCLQIPQGRSSRSELDYRIKAIPCMQMPVTWRGFLSPATSWTNISWFSFSTLCHLSLCWVRLIGEINDVFNGKEARNLGVHGWEHLHLETPVRPL